MRPDYNENRGLKMVFFAVVTVLSLLISPLGVRAEEAPGAEENLLYTGIAEIYAGAFTPEPPSVKKEGEGWQVIFPEIKVEYDALNNDGAYYKKHETIPSSSMSVTRNGEFSGKPMYKLSSDSVARFQSFLYDKFSFHGVRAESYREESYFVPGHKYIAAQDLSARNVVYSSEDIDTGLKKDVFNMAFFNLTTKTAENDDIQLQISLTADKLNFSSDLFTVSAPEIKYKAVTAYAKSAAADYQNIMNNFDDFKNFKFKMQMPNVAVEIPMLAQRLRYSLKSEGAMTADRAAGKAKVKGNVLVYDIVSPAGASAGVKEVKYQYAIENIRLAPLRQFYEMQQKMVQDETLMTDAGYNRQLMENLDGFWEGVVLKQLLDVTFEKGNAKLMLALKKSGNFVVGKGNITLINYDLISPDYTAACEAEMKKMSPSSNAIPEACIKFSALSLLRPYVNLNKRVVHKQGQTVDKIDLYINKSGVYVGGQKLGDAIEIDLKKLGAPLAEEPTPKDLTGK